MKSDVKLVNQLTKEYGQYFKTGVFRGFNDLLRQIAVYRVLENEKEPVIFHVNVMGEHGNEMVLAYSTGGYKPTGIYFIDNNYNTCQDIAEELNEVFFQVDKEEQMKIISKSMSL